MSDSSQGPAPGPPDGKAGRETRFQAFVQRMLEAPDAESHDEALSLLAQTLNGVEDAYTDIPYRPENWRRDGRMYPPQNDNARAVEGRSDVTRYRHKGHNTFVRDNGAIEIRDLAGRVLLRKPGKDGRGVALDPEGK